jgi:hypothetical protein
MAAQSIPNLGSTIMCPGYLQGAFLACLAVFGAQVHAQGIAPQTQGSVSYVSGGVGQDEVCQMKGLQGGYNLHLLFAETPMNQFLADIPVRIVDHNGATVLDTRTQGPYLYAHLAPGTYKIVAENGDRIQSRKVRIGSTVKPTAVSFVWKSTEPRVPRIRVESLPHC